MASMREIKHRIKSVQNTQKITRAMKMVAATKLKRAQERAEGARPFFTKTLDILRGAASVIDPETHPLLAHREIKKVQVLLLTADRGLCGGYNHRIIKMVKEQLGDHPHLQIMAVGKRGRDTFRREGYSIQASYSDIPDYPSFDLARDISRQLVDTFTREESDQVLLAYTRFHSPLSQQPLLIPLLPVEQREMDASRGVREYIMEPDPYVILDMILPRYVENLVYGALLEAKASEFGARMTAMDAATENAQEMIERLTVSYNRARQEEITKEISEIVGGAEALK